MGRSSARKTVAEVPLTGLSFFVERLWRTVKDEEVYLREYTDGWQAEESLGSYFDYYCNERRHQSLKYRTPAEVYSTG